MFKSSLFRFTAAFILISAMSALTLADTIRLKDGSIIKGRITSFGNGAFVIAIGEGSRRRELKFTAAEVESIQFDAAETKAVETAANRTAVYKAPEVKTSESRNTAKPETQPSVIINTSSTSKPQTPVKSTTGEKMKPIEWRVRVLADSTANGWTNSGWVVKKGQRIRIVADEGTVSLGKGQKTTASGLGTFEDPLKLLKNVPTGALIAVIGDDNNDFIYVGAEREFTATRDGALFLGINEGNLDDNSGAFNVKIEIIPG